MTSPLISFITPVFNTEPAALQACIDSVMRQTSGSWQLCVADDGSTRAEVRSILGRTLQDPRVKVTTLDHNCGIVAASNAALDLASGDFVALLDHDDLLAPTAVEEVLTALSMVPDADYLYTDEDKIDSAGQHYDMFCKPDWSPARLRSHNYCCHLSVFRRSLVDSLAVFATGLTVRKTTISSSASPSERAAVPHLPRVLYGWRAVEGSTAQSAEAKPYAYIAARKALQEHCDRLGISATIHMRPNLAGCYRLDRRLVSHPSVSVIIPTNGKAASVWGCSTPLVVNAVDSILRRSTYEHIEVVVVADAATPTAVIAELQRLGGHRLKVVPFDGPFDFSAKINLGVVHSEGEIIVLLNDDTEVISTQWLEVLISILAEDDVGMVGPKLLYPDRRVQSAGHSHAPGPHNIGRGVPSSDPGPFNMFAIERECSGVTAACAGLRRETFLEVGGLSAALPHSYNDVDLSLKLTTRGYRIVWTPDAELFHFESMSRRPRVRPKEWKALCRRWGRLMGQDPYFTIAPSD